MAKRSGWGEGTPHHQREEVPVFDETLDLGRFTQPDFKLNESSATAGYCTESGGVSATSPRVAARSRHSCYNVLTIVCISMPPVLYDSIIKIISLFCAIFVGHSFCEPLFYL